MNAASPVYCVACGRSIFENYSAFGVDRKHWAYRLNGEQRLNSEQRGNYSVSDQCCCSWHCLNIAKQRIEDLQLQIKRLRKGQPMLKMTERQQRIVDMINQGFTNPQIRATLPTSGTELKLCRQMAERMKAQGVQPTADDTPTPAITVTAPAQPTEAPTAPAKAPEATAAKPAAASEPAQPPEETAELEPLNTLESIAQAPAPHPSPRVKVSHKLLYETDLLALLDDSSKDYYELDIDPAAMHSDCAGLTLLINKRYLAQIAQELTDICGTI